ncbi:cryptochrome/photolyase family protein [Streptomyces sp. KM77-8]|uniref:Cryptochrome/photolyase family protein n=1 Tax=Streptomyces haneummycinicus TaxID=3074435 RepID=A0AAT9HGF2_9ACTN
MHWLFGDQLGPHFLTPDEDGPGHDTPLLMIEARSVFRRRRFHRAKAHLVLSAMRHRAAELGDRVTYVRADTYREGLDRAARGRPVGVHHPTSHAALRLVRALPGVTVGPARGSSCRWPTSPRGPAGTAESGCGRRTSTTGSVADTTCSWTAAARPGTGGTWTTTTGSPRPTTPLLTIGRPYRPREDGIDEEVRHDLDRWERDGDVSFVGRDGPRLFPATRAEARRALRRFVEHRLATFGPYEDAMLAADPVMSHSLLSSSLNLGLLDPAECVERAETAWRAGRAPLNSVEGFVRQIAGWREYVWQLYWHFGEDYRRSNELRHTAPLPGWWDELDADAVRANCLRTVLAQVRDTGWTHHIPRLMILGSHALQRGWDPAAVTDWFHRCFVDGYDWVMLPNVVGMSQYADGGRMTTKPYTSGGAYINRMSDLCGPCAYRPGDRTGERACPYTAGYWVFLDRHRKRLAGNPRVVQPVRGLDRLTDLADVREQEHARGDTPP